MKFCCVWITLWISFCLLTLPDCSLKRWNLSLEHLCLFLLEYQLKGGQKTRIIFSDYKEYAFVTYIKHMVEPLVFYIVAVFTHT